MVARRNYILYLLSVIALGAILQGCASAPQPAPLTKAELLRRDQKKGQDLARLFDPQVKVKKDVELNVYLRTLGERLIQASETLAGTPFGVYVINDRNQKWRNFGLPGTRIYLSVAGLKSVQFENEIAALIAFEISNVILRSAIQKLEKEREPIVGQEATRAELASNLKTQETGESENIDFFGPSGIFVFDEKAYLESAKLSVNILHRAGFDPRGLITVWEFYRNTNQHSPYEPTTLSRLIEETRQAISQLTPLRNPIVRSAAFIRVQERIQKL